MNNYQTWKTINGRSIPVRTIDNHTSMEVADLETIEYLVQDITSLEAVIVRLEERVKLLEALEQDRIEPTPFKGR